MDVRTYGIVTGAYWGLTISDGALRMLVLLHFHNLGYSPLELSFLFLAYELLGVITNLLGGWAGSCPARSDFKSWPRIASCVH